MNLLYFLIASGLFFCQIELSSAQTIEKAQYYEQHPQFPGGEDALKDFIKKNIIYPNEAIEKNLYGTVWVQFIVDTTGKPYDFKIIRGRYPELDEEALRVLKLMPAWIPGSVDGKKVKVYQKVPVKFYLPEDKNKKNRNKKK